MTDRRAFLSTLPAGLALVGTTFLAPRLPRAGEPLRVLAWDGYDSEVFYGDFLESGLAAPNFVPFDGGAEVLAGLRAGQSADVAQPCLYDLGAWIDAGVVRPLATSGLVNWRDLWRPLRALCGGPRDGEVWFVPFDWGPASVIYRTDKVEQAPTSWSVLYDERYAGRLAMQRSAEAAIGCAALVLGIKRPWAMVEPERNSVLDLMRRQAALVATYWDDAAAVENGLESGDLVAAYGWNDMYARLRARDVPIAFMRPAEGYLVWVCGLAGLETGKADTAEADAFIDAMLAPTAGAALIARYGYGHANRRSFDLVPGEVLAALALDDPAAILADGLCLDRMEAHARATYAAMFETALAGS